MMNRRRMRRIRRRRRRMRKIMILTVCVSLILALVVSSHVGEVRLATSSETWIN